MNGWGSFSPMVSIQAARRPDAPTAIKVKGSDSGSITLSIGACLDNGGSSITTYTLYRDDGTKSAKFMPIFTGLFFGDFKVTGLMPGLLYYFKTTASNVIGESDFSPEINFFSASTP